MLFNKRPVFFIIKNISPYEQALLLNENETIDLLFIVYVKQFNKSTRTQA